MKLPLRRLFSVLSVLGLGTACLRAAEAVTPRINHIAFYVANLKVSTDFYEKVIGLPRSPNR